MPINISEVDATTGSETGTDRRSSNAITPELVRAVADQIYIMLLHEARINYERGRRTLGPNQHYRGGR